MLELSRSLLGKGRRGKCSGHRKEPEQRPCEYETLEEGQTEWSERPKGL